MMEIPVGKFTMGTPGERERGEVPSGEVAIERAFLLADREVTMAQFLRFMEVAGYPDEDKPVTWSNQREQSLDSPASGVDWFEAIMFCNWLSTRAGFPPAYVRTGERMTWTDGLLKCEADVWRYDATKDGYRLPTEAEWEFACRAMTTSYYSFGDDVDLVTEYGWVVSNSKDHDWPGGLKLPNSWGLFDMHGNLTEWCEDLAKPRERSSGQFIGGNNERMVRGGSFDSQNEIAGSCERRESNPTNAYWSMGFRPARTLHGQVDTHVRSGERSGQAPHRNGTAAKPKIIENPTPAIAPFDAAQAQARLRAGEHGGQQQKSNRILANGANLRRPDASYCSFRHGTSPGPSSRLGSAP